MNRNHLKNLYDCINNIARNHEANGKDRSKWFYSESEFEGVRKDPRNNIY